MLHPLVIQGLIGLAVVGAGTAITIKLLDKPTTAPPATTIAAPVIAPPSPQNTANESTRVFGTRFSLVDFLLILLPFVLLQLLFIRYPRGWPEIFLFAYFTVIIFNDIDAKKNGKKVDNPYLMTICFSVIFILSIMSVALKNKWSNEEQKFKNKTDKQYEEYINSNDTKLRKEFNGTTAAARHEQIRKYASDNSWPDPLMEKMMERVQGWTEMKTGGPTTKKEEKTYTGLPTENLKMYFHGLPLENIEEQIGYLVRKIDSRLVAETKMKEVLKTQAIQYQKENPVDNPGATSFEAVALFLAFKHEPKLKTLAKQYGIFENTIKLFGENIKHTKSEEAKDILTGLRDQLSTYTKIIRPEEIEKKEKELNEIETIINQHHEIK